MVWQALTVTVVASAVLAGLAVAVPVSWHAGSPAGLVWECMLALRARYATPAGAAAGAAGAVLALAVRARLAWSAGSVLMGPRATGPATMTPWPWWPGLGRAPISCCSTTIEPPSTASPAGAGSC